MEYCFTFLEGIASFVSPCFLPMIPIYIAYFAGEMEEKKGKTIRNALGFVLGFTLIFILMSVLASTLGRIIARYLRLIKIVFGILIIMIGLNYMDLIKIKFLNYSKGMKVNTTKLNFVRAFLFGILFAFSYTPCIGMFLGSALLLVTKNQQVLKGILLILCYCIGLRRIVTSIHSFHGTT